MFGLNKNVLASLAVLLVISNVVSGERALTKDGGRQKRLFSVFNIVTFENSQCTAVSDTTMKGSCMSTTDCSSNGGTADGNCASGFGVCCMFIQTACGGTVNHNCTYLRNAEFPSTAPASKTCTFTFNRICDDLCQIRLDFDNLVTAQPPTTGTNTVGLCTTSGDTLIANSPTGVNPPTVCGALTGQHMYMETGGTGSAGSLALTFGATVTTRTYKIKVSYIECSNRLKAPEGCVQYYTGVSGTFTSFNYPNQMLGAQQYATCFRQEKGYCTISIAETPGLKTDAFELYSTTADMKGGDAADVDTCPQTHVRLPVATSISSKSARICGEKFSAIDTAAIASAVVSASRPFAIHTFSDMTLGGNAAATDPFVGYSLNYNMVPC